MEKQIEQIKKYLPIYQYYLDSNEHAEDLVDRQTKELLLSYLMSKEGLLSMTELEFGQLMSSLWASRMWSNKSYWVENLLDENEIETLKNEFFKLLWSDALLNKRYDQFRKATKGFGTAIISEIMAFIDPDQYGIWNDKARKALTYLGFKDQLPFIKKSQLSGKEYQQFNDLLLDIKQILVENDYTQIDLLAINYFFFEVARRPRQVDENQVELIEEISKPISADDFDHDEAIDKVVAIGGWLGFEAEKEKSIAKGARVDAVWQARIANLGVVTYVFEVQRKGSVDSLILNLQKAQNNPSVQRLVVVAVFDEIQKIRSEIETLPESFRKAVSYIEVSEIFRASELLSEFSEIIGKLNLVQSEFGV